MALAALVGRLGAAGGERPGLTHRGVRHDRRPAAGRPAPIPATTSRPRPERDSTVAWGTYGYDDRRLRFAPGIDLRPPFRRIWTFRGRALLEFPQWHTAVSTCVRRPLLRAGCRDGQDGLEPSHPPLRLGLARRAGAHRLRHVHRAPLDLRRLRPQARRHRRRLRRRQRQDVWQRTTGLNESSPLVAGSSTSATGTAGSGRWTRTGRTRWTLRTGGRIKGSLALSGGQVYVGDYDGGLYAVNARTSGSPGAPRRNHGSGGGEPSTRRPPSVTGASSSAAPTGRSMRTAQRADGCSGRRARVGTSDSPAVWRRLILVGSYDHSFYALDAATTSAGAFGRTARSRDPPR